MKKFPHIKQLVELLLTDCFLHLIGPSSLRPFSTHLMFFLFGTESRNLQKWNSRVFYYTLIQFREDFLLGVMNVVRTLISYLGKSPKIYLIFRGLTCDFFLS